MAPKKTRWVKVEISYREAGRLDEWNAVVLGETSMIVEVTDPRTPALSPILVDLTAAIQRAAVELVQRTETLTPPAAEEAVA